MWLTSYIYHWTALLSISLILLCFAYYAFILKITPTPSSRVSRLVCMQLCQTVHTQILQSSSITFIDLGSGWGGLLRLLAKKGPSNWKYIGYEIMPLACAWSKITTYQYPDLTIHHSSFQKHDFTSSTPTFLFSYLCPEQMESLSTLFQHIPPKQTLLITLTFNLPNHTPLLRIPIPYSLNQTLDLYLFNWPELESNLREVFANYLYLTPVESTSI